MEGANDSLVGAASAFGEARGLSVTAAAVALLPRDDHPESAAFRVADGRSFSRARVSGWRPQDGI